MGLSSTQVCMDYTACAEDKDPKVGMEVGLLTERRGKPPPEQALKCPRCDSSNTKFCYYNNYSLSQPRYFCKTCRRYWTKGGTLRNVPVGGGCRKNKKPKKTTEETSSASATSGGAHDHTHNELTRILDKENSNIPSLSGSAIYYGNDMNMEFARIHDASSSFKNSTTSDFLAMSYDAGVHSMKSSGFSGMEFLKSLRGEHGDVNCLVEPIQQYSDGGALHNFAPLAGLNSMLYPETYLKLHEPEQQKFETFSKEIGAGPMVLNLGDQTAEHSFRQPKQEFFTNLGFTQAGEELETARNSIYWNHNGAASATWPYNYGSSSVSPLN